MAVSTEDEVRVSLEASKVPRHLHEGLVRYIAHRIKPGHFLTAVLENDLKMTVATASVDSMDGLVTLVQWLYMEAPSDCWGNPVRVDAWIAGETTGRTAEGGPHPELEGRN